MIGFLLRMYTLQRIRFGRRVVLGGGGVPAKGWVVTDKKELDITDRSQFARYWRAGTRSAFFAEHVWEHLDAEEARQATRNCYEFLKPGGRLRVAVPDGLHPDPAYIAAVRPGGSGAGAQDHRVLYTFEMLRELLDAAGFETQLLEYWDHHGEFHAATMDEWYGVVWRSAKNDPRNAGGRLVYTSLIVDGVKARGR